MINVLLFGDNGAEVHTRTRGKGTDDVPIVDCRESESESRIFLRY